MFLSLSLYLKKCCVAEQGVLLSSPDAVQHISILKYAQKLVVSGDFMEVGPFLIGKEKIRLPNGVQH